MAPAPGKQPYQIWRDGGGRLSALRIVTMIGLVTPLLIALYDFNIVGFGARPLNDLIHRAGFWALMFLLMSLAVTPLRRIARFNQLLDVRRMIGVAAFAYAATHILLYAADQMFDLRKVVSEIALRLYLTIGFVALLGLGALTATSTDGMVRRLGARRWQMLHQAIYVVALLALVHYFQQTKADESVPTFVAGLFLWLVGYRLLVKWRNMRAEPPAWMLALLSVVVSALVFVGEAVGISIVFNAPAWSVLSSAFDIDFSMLDSLRPGWLVLGAGLCVVLVDLVRARFAKARGRRGRPVPASANPVRNPA